MKFETLQLSPPVPSSPSVRMLTFFSSAMGRRGDLSLYLPSEHLAGNDGKLPLLLLLHGVYDSHWAWWLKGEIDRTAEAMTAAGEMEAMAIAMPSDGLWGQGSGYLTHGSENCEEWLMGEVPDCLEQMFPRIETSRFALAGLSMGGFGALRLGMKHSGRVRAISAHSSITDVRQMSQFVDAPVARYCETGAEDADLLHWAEVNRSHLPPLRFDCGSGDPLLEANRQLHAELTQRSIAHEYEEFDGGHNWDYWRQNVRKTLAFTSRRES